MVETHFKIAGRAIKPSLWEKIGFQGPNLVTTINLAAQGKFTSGLGAPFLVKVKDAITPSLGNAALAEQVRTGLRNLTAQLPLCLWPKKAEFTGKPAGDQARALAAVLTDAQKYPDIECPWLEEARSAAQPANGDMALKAAGRSLLFLFIERGKVRRDEVKALLTDNFAQTRINEIIDLSLPPPYSFEGVRAVIALRKELKALSESEAAYRAENVKTKQAQFDGYISGARGTAKLPEEAFIEKTLSVEVKTDHGTVWHQYELVRHLGKDGGMGRVFAARRLGDEVAGRLFVIKVLKLDLLDEMEKNFLKEGARITELDHKGIVKGYGTGHVLVTEGKPPQPFMVMEKHQMSLQQALDDNLLNPEQKLFVLREVIEALRYIWETKHLLHRDIKPDNVLLDFDTEGKIVAVKVADFGLSKSLDEIADNDELMEMTKTARVMGTLSFMAPEVAEITSAKREGGQREAKLRESAEKTDIYQLGNFAHRLQFNCAPSKRDFSKDSNLWWKFAYAKGADLAQYTLVKPADATHVTSAMWDFILRTMEINPAKRLQTWAAVAEAASKIDLPKPEEEEPTEVTPPPQPFFANEDEALHALRIIRTHLWGEESPVREALERHNTDLLALLAGFPQSRDVADWAAPALAQINKLLGGE